MADALSVVAVVVFVASWIRPIAISGQRALHILQLEEYQTKRFWRWLGSELRAAVDPWLLLASLVVLLAAAALPRPFWVAAVVLSAGGGVWFSRSRTIPPAKKPLVLTARVKRLIAGYFLGGAVVAFVVGWGSRSALAGGSAPLVAASGLVLLVLAILIWPLASTANLLLYPVEAGFRSYYLWSAGRILGTYRPTVLGVAGSYGKTSTKTILARILDSRYPTLATPRSFNTPMGLCRVIREQLRPEHRFFIAELGAYQRGEIRQLCRLVRPTIGILTSIGPEHLERFGSMAEVVAAESELFEALPPDGFAIVNGDDSISREVAGRARCPVAVVGGPPAENRLLWAEGVALSADGVGFTLCHRDGSRTPVNARLLGRHNVGNIMLASAAALQCGLSVADLVPAIERIDPVEHRLQLVPNDNGVIVIDDTYNSNPRGAAAALETLASFPGGRRHLVTPGMVELADLQDEAHREFGRQAARVCDNVILIGPRRTQAIADGLAAAGFAGERVIVTKSLAEATDRLRGVLQRGDIVLFENDLPDNYSE